jgi:DNA polymerase I-like protein with 3'-5' exonuclease and polymerase domains
MKPATPEAYELLHKGAQALAKMEANGIKIDTKKLKNNISLCEKKQADIYEYIQKLHEMKLWKKKYKKDFNINSLDQLGDILFNEMGIKPKHFTAKGNPSTDSTALEAVGTPFVKEFLRYKKYEKTIGTFLKGLQKEIVNGYLHPFFNLHLVDTYRSSSDSPNFQNLPIRDGEIAELIRSVIVSRFKNGHIAEADFSGIEVKVAACYHKDPVMLDYIHDKSKDMHRDAAMACFMIKEVSEVTKQIRYSGKNKYVFPEFYGSWWKEVAVNLWDSIDQLGLKTASGIPLKELLKKQGIRKLGDFNEGKPLPHTFCRHIKEVEDKFWNETFKVYTQWKKDWYNAYLKKGYFTSLTGFVYSTLCRKNQVINYPIQGSAFHCLLYCVIKIMEKLEKYKMKSLAIAQIHDSELGDTPHKELNDYTDIVRETMEVDLLKHFPWIIVPMEIEMEVSPMGGSWFEKKGWDMENKIWIKK